MSSATHAPTQATTEAPEIQPGGSDPIDRGFGRAIVIGALVGIPAFMAIIAAIVKAQWDLDWWSAAAVAVWTGIWAGLFMGGTLVVGRWSAKNMH